MILFMNLTETGNPITTYIYLTVTTILTTYSKLLLDRLQQVLLNSMIQLLLYYYFMVSWVANIHLLG